MRNKNISIDYTPPESHLKFLKLLNYVERITPMTKAFYQCVCGEKKAINIGNAKFGRSLSCGCYQKLEQSKRQKTHGLTNHPLYRIWSDIKVRCYLNGRDNSVYYSDRGVKMCDEWRGDFMSFYNWAIKNGWEKGKQIDKDKKAKELGISPILYSPEMCSILTIKENCNYRKTSRRLTYNGITKTVTEWEEEMKLPNEVILQRLNRGWGVEKSIITPLLKGKNKNNGIVSGSRQNG